MGKIGALLADNQYMDQFVHSPVFSSQELHTTVKQLGAKLNFADLTIHFIRLLINNNRLSLLHDICIAFNKINCLQNHQYQLDLVLAQKVSDSFLNKLQQLLEHKVDGNINFNVIIDSNIIGGFIIKNDVINVIL